MLVAFPAHRGSGFLERSVPETYVRCFEQLLKGRIQQRFPGEPVRVYPNWTGAGKISVVPPAPGLRPGEASAVLDIKEVRSAEKEVGQMLGELLVSDEWKVESGA